MFTLAELPEAHLLLGQVKLDVATEYWIERTEYDFVIARILAMMCNREEDALNSGNRRTA